VKRNVTSVAPLDDKLTVDQILNTPAEFDHSFEVRSIGPSIIITIENEAPLRFDVLASTDQEAVALRAWLEQNDYASYVWQSFLEAQSAQQDRSDEFTREDVHADRLDRGQKISTLRVA